MECRRLNWEYNDRLKRILNMAVTNNSTNTPELTLNGQTLIGSTGSDPVAGTLTAGTGVSITNGAGTITISSSGSSGWIDQTSTPVTMIINTGYVADDGATEITFTLPAAASIGDFVEILGKGTGLYIIAQASGQQIHFGNLATTSGAGGSITSTLTYDNIRLRCITANTTWTVVSSVGNFTVT